MKLFPRTNSPLQVLTLSLSLLGTGAGFIAPLPAQAAAWRATVDLAVSENEIVLRVNKVPALRFDRVDSPKLMHDRPYLVAKRLQALINNGFNPKYITVKDTDKGSVIIAGGGALLTVTDAEAQAKGMSRQSVAETWARTLKKLLSLPPLEVTPSRLVVPMGETRGLEVGGIANGTIEIATEPAGFATATVEPGTRKITLEGKAIGSGTLIVRIGEFTDRVEFSVKKPAGRIGTAFVSITGNGPDRLKLREVVKSAIARSADVEPGATLYLEGDNWQLPREITPQGASLSIPVRIEGGGFLPVRVNVQVKLIAEEVGRTEPNVLMYSNDPEMLRKYGLLYTGVIRTGQAVRMLYHHQNAMGAPVRFVLQLQNGDDPARLQIIDGSAPTQIDTYQIGHRAAARFLPLWLTDSGYVQTLKPHETLTLLDQRLAKDIATSGLYHFVLISGGPVTLQIRAEKPGEPFGMVAVRPNPEVYPTTRKRIETTYAVGGKWGFIPFGRDPVQTKEKSHPLEGDYGVVYDMTVHLENPTDQRNSAEVAFDPAAGIARGVFLVDGKMLETTHLQPPQEYVLGTYSLEPGEKRDVHILTMPLAGSNYPARFSVRPRSTIARQP